MNGVNVSTDLAKTTILVVDAKVHFRDMVQSALTGAGAKSVKHATNVEKAIETLNRYGQEINCVICDWEMAPLSGLDLLRMIRTRQLAKTAPRTPVVILTARADAAAVKTAMALDVNGFAVAPLSFEKLVKTVQAALTRTWILHPSQHYDAVPPLAAAPPTEPRVHVGKDPAADELKNVHMCPLKDVVPGQVLARDLRDKDGHLLLSTGAVLKPNIIERLKDVADGHADSYHVWVGEQETTKERA
jgi:CheY-like chemotaxis protein